MWPSSESFLLESNKNWNLGLVLASCAINPWSCNATAIPWKNRIKTWLTCNFYTPHHYGVAFYSSLLCPTFQINAHHEIRWQVQLNVLSNLPKTSITNDQSEMVEMVEILLDSFLVIFWIFLEMASLLILLGLSIISHPAIGVPLWLGKAPIL